MQRIIRVFDNNARTTDRYTVVVDSNVYGMSVEPNSKSGVNQFNGIVGDLQAVVESLAGKYDKNIGHEVELLSLPFDVRIAIGKRLKTA